MEEVLKSSRFHSNGFDNILVANEDKSKSLHVRSNIYNRSDFIKWKDIFCEITCCSLNSLRLLASGEDHRNIFGQTLQCHHGRKTKGIKKICTGCRFRIVVIIKSATVDKVKKDRLLENYPCFITIQGQHNHGTMSAQEIRELRVLPDVKETLEDYFEQDSSDQSLPLMECAPLPPPVALNIKVEPTDSGDEDGPLSAHQDGAESASQPPLVSALQPPLVSALQLPLVKTEMKIEVGETEVGSLPPLPVSKEEFPSDLDEVEVKQQVKIEESMSSPTDNNGLTEMDCKRSCSPFSDGLEQSEDSEQSASDHDGDETWERNTKVQLRSQTATVPTRAKRARKAMKTTNAPTSPEAAPSSSGVGGTIRCLHCDYECFGQDLLDGHLKRRHGHIDKKGRHKCEWCQYSTDTASRLADHRRMHTGELYRCDVCGKGFTRRATLTIHCRNHTGEKPYKCDVCGKAFSQRDVLVGHYRIHTGEKPYKCDVCEKAFSQQSTLIGHHRLHTGEKPFECNVCGKVFTHRKGLVVHGRVHTGERPHCCDVCGKKFSHRSGLISHQLLHSSQRPFQCDVCRKTFKDSSDLAAHQRIHTEDRPHRCDVCGKAFGKRYILINHHRTHTGQKPFKCDVCGKAYTRNKDLTSHRRLHTSERPYHCTVCDQTFVRQRHLTFHQRVHTDQRQDECDV